MTSANKGLGIVLTDTNAGSERFFPVISMGEGGTVTLDLCETRLRDLPEELLLLDDVEVLYLNVVDMNVISESIQKLKNLSILQLACLGTGTGLHEFPAAVTGISNLISLDLFGNVNLTHFPAGICCHLKRLQTLLMVLCRVKTLPSDFGEMTELRHLDVRDNPVHNLSEAVSGLHCFNWIGLESERLGDFIDQAPSHILANLTTVGTECSSTSTLPRQLLSLQSLDTLHLYNHSSELWNSFPLLRHHLARAADCGHDLVIPPGEILDSGREAVDSYYQSLEDSLASRRNRVKALLNGKSMAGKTSLVNAVQHALREREWSPSQRTPVCCLTGKEDRTVSVEYRQLQLGDINIRVNDTGGHEVYSLTNQLVTTDNSLIITAIDSSQYEMTEKQFYEQVGKYLHVVFDLLVKAVIVLVLSKIDSCDRNKLAGFVDHITSQVEVYEKERNLVSRHERQRDQRVTVHKTVIMTSAKTLEGIEDLLDCMNEIFHQPEFLPSMTILPQSWVLAEDYLTEMALHLTPPISTMQETVSLLTGLQTRIGESSIPYLLSYLHRVGSVLHFSGHRGLRNYVFPDSHFVVDLMKTLYRHDVESLSLTAVDETQGDMQIDETDIPFEGMKKQLTENGSVDVRWLRLIWSQFNLNLTHHDLLLNLLFKFDLAYPKCANEGIHRRIRELIERTDEKTLVYCSELRSEVTVELNVSDADLKGGPAAQLALLREVLPDEEDAAPEKSLLYALQTTGTQLLLPWFLRDEKPLDIPDISFVSCDYVQVVSTYAFRYCVPVGLFDRLSARCSRHVVYCRHWKSGLYFSYGPVSGLFRCETTRPVPNITLNCRVPKSTHNPKRLCHVLRRCIQDMEDLLQTMPGVPVSRYISRAVTDSFVEIGARQTMFQPLNDGPSFVVQAGACGGGGICEDLLKCLQEVTKHPLISTPLSQLFSSRCGDPLTKDKISCIPRGICHPDVWIDVADALDLPEEFIDDLSESTAKKRTGPSRVLKKWLDHRPHCALVCVLCDALYCLGQKSVADRIFDPQTYVDRILRLEENDPDVFCGPPAKQARHDQRVTPQHVDVIVRCCSVKWLAMGRVLLCRSDDEVLDFVSHLYHYLSGHVRYSDKLRCLIEGWLKEKGEEATISDLIQACGHPDIDKRGGVELELKQAGLLPLV